ncbi:hypothetical protein Cpir12675_005590 [Ceratocystis pirilliformis]|uniref:Uncharacterized protein n=1 Tax=Ceratocystis pirilliformis TaxID=259994 RepID=A0ABR3YNK3_9PEZI
MQAIGPIKPHFFFFFRGDNRYFLSTGFNDASHNLPPGEHLSVFDESWQTMCVSWQHSVESVMVNYRDWKWERNVFLTSPAAETTYGRLHTFLAANRPDDVRVVFGPHGSYVAWTQSEPLTLSEWPDRQTCARMTPVVLGARLEIVALGVAGAHYIKTRDGHATWELYGRYDALSRALKAAPVKDVTFVALNPDRDHEFLLVLRNKIAVMCLPERIVLAVRRHLESRKYTCIVLAGRDGDFAIPEGLSWEKALEYTHAVVAISSECAVM